MNRKDVRPLSKRLKFDSARDDQTKEERACSRKRYIHVQDLQLLALGSAILGSGGGGNPINELLLAQYLLEQYGPVELLEVDELQSSDVIAPLAFMGAPTVALERLQNGKEFTDILKRIKECKGKVTAVMPAEIGGLNLFTPIIVAALYRLPVLNADLIGRAFPSLEMSSAHVSGISPSPAFLSDGLGTTVTLEIPTAQKLEQLARAITIALGSNAAIVSYIMNGLEAKRSVIPGTITQALELGVSVVDGRNSKKDVVECIIAETSGVLLGTGTVTDIKQEIKDGFLKGTVTIEGSKNIIIEYQNEYLLARIDGQVKAMTPDIIAILDSQTGTAITSESLAFGNKVSVVAIAAPLFWRDPKALAIVGPRAFGYDFDYINTKELNEIK